MYVLGLLPKKPFFNNISDVDDVLELQSPKFQGFNQLSSAKSHVLEKRSFEPVKFFTLDIELLAIPGKSQKTVVEFVLSDVASLVISKWLILVGKDSVCVVLATNNKKLWVVKDCYWALLYILPVDITAHDLSNLLNLYDGKTCFIGHNFSSYVHNRCAVVCFNNKTFKLAAISSTPVFKSVNLYWAGFFLACCTKCKQFGHIFDVCLVGGNSETHYKWVVSSQDQVYLVNIYKRKQALIACGSFSHVALSVPSGADPLLSMKFLEMASNLLDDSGLANHMTSLECFLELLSDQISEVLKKLSFVKLVPISSPSSLDLSMAVDGMVVFFSPSLAVVKNAIPKLSLSSSKVLTTKVGGLKSKMMALKVSVSLILVRLDSLCSSLGLLEDIVHWHKDIGNLISIFTETKLQSKAYLWISDRFDSVYVFTFSTDSGNLGSGIAIIMDISLACHVCKISEIPGRLLSFKLLFKNKLSVLILGLYAGASLSVWFSQAGKINSMIAKAVNKPFFVVLSGNFNKNGSYKCTSFKKCLDLNLFNFLSRNSFVKTPTWINSCGVAKMINFLFISSNLVNAVINRNMCNIGEFFDTDHQTVFVSMDLGGLLNMQLNLLCKQVNKDWWKFDFKNASETKWNDFGSVTSANVTIFSNEFATTMKFLDLDVMILSANEMFKKKWFKGFDNVFTKEFSKFHKLKLLVSRIVKTSYEESAVNFDSFMKCWVSLNNVKTLVVQDVMDSGTSPDHVHSALFGAEILSHI
ncbi:hypothetical protein G9A89_011396 [Geosiphon pyriformis]|nr:hypothetical protein G9A89_011396 [Geosiphon pyriformis]